MRPARTHRTGRTRVMPAFRVRPARARERAMTLLEVLVAMLIVLIMMTFLVPLYLRTTKVKSRTEEVAALHATGRGATAVLRRDLTGAFRTAVAMYDFGSHSSGREFHWEAPVNPADLSRGFRRITFVSAVDGSRLDVAGNVLYPFEYNLVSWAARGGVIYREVGSWSVAVTADSPPAGWLFSPGDLGQGIAIGAQALDVGAVLADVGAYRGAPYVITTTTLAVDPMQFKHGGLPVPVTVTVCFPAGQTVPGWAELDFVKAADAAENRLTVDTGSGVVPCALYSKLCPDGRASLGPNVAGSRYFVIVEPGWWSLGEEAEDLVFYPPASYVGPTPPPDTNGNGIWEDADDGVADSIWSSGVPRYVDAVLTIADPDDPNTGKRVFGERVAVPAGVEP